jgi:glycosyltransferase involved in cell wall biosynthesis
VRRFRILVYGDVDLNVIDGSSVWLQSVVTALQHIPRAEVTVQLKRPIVRDVLTAPLAELDRVRLVPHPVGEGRRLLPARAPTVLAELDAREGGFDAILLRGFAVCRAAAEHSGLAGRLWCYVTDFPQSRESLSAEDVEQLERVAAASQALLCQTGEFRSFLETHVPGVIGKTSLLPPLVPDMADDPPQGLGLRRGTRMVYAGKFSPLWRTEELVAAIGELRDALPEMELVVAGDKIHEDPGDPGYAVRMERALRETRGVNWLGGLPREQVQDVIATADFGVSLRDPALDGSLELSTKVLECGRAGVPPLVSRTSMHERLLGEDYPLFVDSGTRLADCLLAAVQDDATYSKAATAAWTAARKHTFRSVSRLLGNLVERCCPEPAVTVREPRRVLLAGHDLKFAGPLIQHLDALRDVELRVERWSGVNSHDEDESRANLAWADAVLAEWCLGNALWYSGNRRPGQRLVSRFHRFERDTQFPDQIPDEGLDYVGFVAEHIRASMVPRMAIDGRRMGVIPNAVPVSHLQRAKLPGSDYNLGILGVSPSMKRLDLAVETLRLLRGRDERFVLYVKGPSPIDYWWIWGRPEERAFYLDLANEIGGDPLLRDAVVFDRGGPDVAEWFRKIGFILSMSDFESFHMAVAEGSASGAIPVIRDWEGARELYPDESVISTPAEAAEAIWDAVASGATAERQRGALEPCLDAQSLDVCRAWERVLLAPAMVA